MPDNFKIIYRILKTLERAMDTEEFDNDFIYAEALRISEPRWVEHPSKNGASFNCYQTIGHIYYSCLMI